MKCISCGGSNNPSVTENFVQCTYCGTFFPNAIGQLHFSNTSSFPQNEFEVLNSHEDFLTLKDVAYSAVRSNPTNWLAYTYLGIAEFWLGNNSFNHIDAVVSNFDKAFQLSNDNAIIIYKNSILNSSISLACKNKPYGDELTSALRIFEYCKSRKVEVAKEIKQQQIEFANQVVSKIVGNLNSELETKKDKFDTTFINLVNLFKLSIFGDSKEGLEKFYLYSQFHLEKNSGKSYTSELKKYIDEAAEFLRPQKSSVLGKKISFSFFGKLKIE